jgi:hypothetical protein
MTLHPGAGKPAPAERLVDVGALRREYCARTPGVIDPAQQVSFGTSGHRGSSLGGAFNEAHVLAITQAICSDRIRQLCAESFRDADHLRRIQEEARAHGKRIGRRLMRTAFRPSAAGLRMGEVPWKNC